MQRRQILLPPDFPERIDAGLDSPPAFARSLSLVGGCERDDEGGRVRDVVWIEKMRGSQGLEVFWIVAGGGDWAFVDDRFDLRDQSDEGIDLEGIFRALGGEMAFEELNNAFPDATLVRGARGNEGPRDADALQFRCRRQIPSKKLILDGGIGARKVWSVVADEVFNGRTSSSESANRLDDGVGVVFEDDFGVDASGFEAGKD